MSQKLQKGNDFLRAAWRSQQILYVVSRYGVLEGLASIGIEIGKRGITVTRVRRYRKKRLDRLFGKKLVETFIRLGPSFIKLGQVLAVRPDMVGEGVADELRVLFDRVPPIPYARILRIMNREMGRECIRKWFRSIERTPMASASIAQTHRAVLSSGIPVILKVQKEGTADLVKLDLMILETFARSAHQVLPNLQLWPMFQEYKNSALREINYLEEAKNIDRFRKNYKKLFADSDVVFPRYFPTLTTEKVLVLEPMRGKKVADLKKGSTVARKAATRGVQAMLEQIFDHGFFHADPHGANVFYIEEGNRIGFIDLGMVGQLNQQDKQKFLKVLMAVLKRDKKNLASALYNLGVPGKKTDKKKFEKDIQKLLEQVRKAGVDNIRMDELVRKMLGVAKKNKIRIPNRYVLMMRSFLIIEGVAKELDPKISLFKIAPPIVAKSLLKSYNPLRRFRS